MTQSRGGESHEEGGKFVLTGDTESRGESHEEGGKSGSETGDLC